jgi:hypothetical protein
MRLSRRHQPIAVVLDLVNPTGTGLMAKKLDAYFVTAKSTDTSQFYSLDP